MRLLRTGTLALITTAALVGVAACTGGSQHGANGDSAGGGAAGFGPAQRVASEATTARPTVSAPQGTGEFQLGTAKIRAATMSVTVKHGTSVATQADNAESIATRAGGEVDADDRTSGPYPTATLVVRVPPEQLGAVLDDLARLGTEKLRHLSTQDVTAKVADVTSRATSARLEIARLRDLYQHATKISDVITVESELAARESDLESLEAQQRALAAQTATASITLTLTSAPAPAPKPTTHHHRSGFLGGLQNGWDAFTGFLGAVATAAGAILPFALLALVLLVAGRLVWTRLRPTRAPQASSPQ